MGISYFAESYLVYVDSLDLSLTRERRLLSIQRSDLRGYLGRVRKSEESGKEPKHYLYFDNGIVGELFV